jgi:formate dehydrogenase subunit gamma
MTRGQVTGGWAWRHHRKWLKELVTGKTEDEPGAGAKSVH